MQTLPNAPDLVEAVAEWIEGPLSTALTGSERFNARVAANVLRTVERELRAGAAHHDQDRVALSEFLSPGTEVESDDALVAAIAARVRAGDLDARRPELLTALHGYTVRKLQVGNPRYLASEDTDR
jgi:hypothetical protein